MSAQLDDEEIESRYHLTGRMAIVSAIDELVRRRESVTVYFDGGLQFFITTMLEAGPHGIVFDLGGHEPTNVLLPQADNAIFVARPNGIRVQFASVPVSRIVWGGQPAFTAPLPARVARLQRRESYRIETPKVKPIALRMRDAEGNLIGERPLHDLCVAGCGVDGSPEMPLEPGVTLPRIEFALPGGDRVRCAARVRHVTASDSQRRLGLEFVDLPRPLEIEIQRYIVAIEHERYRLATGG